MTLSKVIILETVLILVLLVALTRSLKMSMYMMATILITYVSALGLGIFLVDMLFGYESISTRVQSSHPRYNVRYGGVFRENFSRRR
ncbi:hypothetical protein [Paenibacillus sp. LC231]|uniref:hypothetical protein n=1 Tax=Paenibacillus sp. LC231 TaxID=1120679 RepID=UPI001F2AD272|nr:hypothetical protein [Paenibacillus sp. LC231]